MIVEIKTGRTWQVWIDGVRPTREWVIGEAEESPVEGIGTTDTHHRYATIESDGLPLTVGEHRLEWLAFDIPDEDWVWDINTRLGPTEAVVKLVGQDPIWMRVADFWYLTEGEDGPITKGVKTESGEWVEIDETEAFVRLEMEP